MLAIAAAVALLLGAAGIYGVISYIASQRTREAGVRMALGAQTGDVSRLFLRHGLVLPSAGVAIGIGLSLAVTQVMLSLLFGVSPVDPPAYAAVSACLAGVAVGRRGFPRAAPRVSTRSPPYAGKSENQRWYRKRDFRARYADRVTVLVIGGGGREHALVWKLAQSRKVRRIVAAPGNPGIGKIAECVAASSIEDYLRIARQYDAALTVVGPEAPLVAGVVDLFRAARMPIVGPTSGAAQLEGSKSFSKDFMVRAGIPTARYTVVDRIEDARHALDGFGFPVVLKADGLAAGKGVVIAQDRGEAERALPQLLGGRLVMEEFLEGEEVSFIALSDGRRFVALQPSQDHKAVFDGDRGPNTGGMGAYSDSRILTPRQSNDIIDRVIAPAIDCMHRDECPFTGFLYAGLMMTAAGPKVLEFNARLGDPETQALLHRMDSDFVDVLAASAAGSLDGAGLEWKRQPSVCVVLAAQGYPGEVRTGDRIEGIAEAEQEGAVVFQAGTRAAGGGIETAGGRVLGVTASGKDLPAAIGNAYRAARRIRFDGMHYRTDIGAKGLKRQAGDTIGTAGT